jgi:hypothetical protein
MCVPADVQARGIAPWSQTLRPLPSETGDRPRNASLDRAALGRVNRRAALKEPPFLDGHALQDDRSVRERRERGGEPVVFDRIQATTCERRD